MLDRSCLNDKHNLTRCEAVVTLILLLLKSFTRSEASAAVSTDAIFKSRKRYPLGQHADCISSHQCSSPSPYLILHWTMHPPPAPCSDPMPSFPIVLSFSPWLYFCPSIHSAGSCVSNACIHFFQLWDKGLHNSNLVGTPCCFLCKV